MKIRSVTTILLCFALVCVFFSACIIAPIDPATLQTAKRYRPGSGALLSTYEGYDRETFSGVCRFYRKSGYALYCSADINGNSFCTFTKGDTLAHVYWIDSHKELTVITDSDGAMGLPANTRKSRGNTPTAITQLQQLPHQASGMGYVVTLSDGSFLIYDGGYTETELMQVLTERNGGSKSGIHIRAWVLTHSHNDHYSAFSQFAKTYKDNGFDVQLDCVMIAPVNNDDAVRIDADESPYFAATIYDDIRLFEGAKLCYVYTGMVFTLGNVKLEILFTPDELFVDGEINYSDEEFFNETSMVSRISARDPKKSGETLGMLFLGDAGKQVGERLSLYYGDCLRTDMVQISHHGVENFPLSTYQTICPAILFYPCNMSLYNLEDRDADVRQAMREAASTKEILLRDNELYTRFLNPDKNPG